MCNVPCGLFKFLKRQDLLNVLARMMRPICDQVVCNSQISIQITLCGVCNVYRTAQMRWTVLRKVVVVAIIVSPTASVCLQQIKVTLNEEDMDTFVFAVGTKKAMARLQKEMQDLVNILHNLCTSK